MDEINENKRQKEMHKAEEFWKLKQGADTIIELQEIIRNKTIHDRSDIT